MTHLTQEEIAELKAKLEEEKSRVTEELTHIGRKNPTNPADWEPTPQEMDIQEADKNEAADRIEGFEENTAILKELEKRFNDIGLALTKIEDKTYGVCMVCGKEIKKERLYANPAAVTCIEHADQES